MKKETKISLIISAILAFIVIFTMNVYAGMDVSISESEVSVGDSFTVTVSGINGRISITGDNCSVSPSSTFVEGSATITCTATSSGTGTVTIIPEDVSTDDADPVEVTEKIPTYITITSNQEPAPVVDPDPTPDDDEEKKNNIPSEGEEKEVKEESRNNYLSSLTVNLGTLTPSFNRETQDYTLEFPKDFDYTTLKQLVVTSTLEDETASKEGDGTYDVKEGENSISIRVTAESGNYRTYVIKFTKAAEVKASDLKLSSLVINMKDTAGKMTAATLMPNFKPDVFEYSMKVSKDIESLSITPTTDLEDVEIKVDGGKNLIPGKNVVTITLTSKKDNKVISKYVINVEKEKEEAAATNSEEENKGGWSIKEWLLLIAGIAFVALIVVLVVLFIIMRRNKLEGEDEFNEDSEEDETKIEAEISEHIRNFDKPEVEEEINIDSAEEKEIEPKLDFVEEEKETEEPKQEIDFSKDPDELPVEEVKEEKVVEEKKELPLIETTLDDIRETERKLDEEDPRGRYRGKRFE